jgi:hypothetical protein
MRDPLPYPPTDRVVLLLCFRRRALRWILPLALLATVCSAIGLAEILAAAYFAVGAACPG